MIYAYFGHHKCASTWIWTIINQVCREAGLRHEVVLDHQTPSQTGPLTGARDQTFPRSDLYRYLQRRGTDFVSCITADAEQARALGPELRGFHVVRDPRDIIVSAYFSHRNSHPTEGLPHMQAHRERLQNVSKEEGLFLEMDFSAKELEDLRTWDYDRPDILEVHMEELTQQPYQGFLEIFEFLELMRWESDYQMPDRIRTFMRTGLNRLSLRHGALDVLRTPVPVTGEMLLGRVYDHRFEKKTGGRSKGKENTDSHYRKGVAGDWANHFTPEHVAHFKERYADLLVKMGYETDDDWSQKLGETQAAAVSAGSVSVGSVSAGS